MTEASSPRPFSFSFQTMGTLAHASMSGRPSQGEFPSDAQVKDALIALVEECDARMSAFKANSDINGSGQISEHTARVVEAAEVSSRETNGYFSAFLGPWTEHWRAVATGGRAPHPGKPSHSALSGMDLGGIAKGYAADQMRDLALAMGRVNALISLGGSSIATAGHRARIALSSPWVGRERLGILRLNQGSLSVSASPQTRIDKAKQRLHILDPHTGDPALSDLCMAVVCGADGMKCEAFSTAYLAMGLDASLELDQRHDDIDTVFATVDGRLIASSRLHLRTAPGLAQWLRQHQ